jgi:MFS family permease
LIKTDNLNLTAGPVCGGFLSQAAGWRWIFWVLAIAIGVVSIAAAPIIRETYAPVLLERKTARLRKENGNPNLRSKLQLNLTPKEVFVRAIARPTKLLFLSPICGLMSLYMGMESIMSLLRREFKLTCPKLLCTEFYIFSSRPSPSSSSNRTALASLLGMEHSISI